MNDSPFSRLSESIIRGYDDRVDEDLTLLLNAGANPFELIDACLIPAINEVGALWKAGDYYLPDVILSVEAFKAAGRRLEALLRTNKRSSLGHVVIGVVEGDVHDLGKDIVATLLEVEGFSITDLGVDVSVEGFIRAVREEHPDILAVGAYMSTTVPGIEKTLRALTDSGLRHNLKIMVGGIPITRKIAEHLGAEGFGEDALEAARCARGLMGTG